MLTQATMNKESLERERLQKNRVIVYIWTSEGNPNTPGQDVGHFAIKIEEKNKYWSLWPRQACPYRRSAQETEGTGLITGISHEWPDYETDLKYERRNPEVVYCFYSLATDKMEEEFDTIGQTLEGWSLLALCANTESCASLGWLLLCAGGIQSLSSKLAQTEASSLGFTKGSALTSGHAAASAAYASTSQSEKRQAATDGSKATSFYSSEMAVAFIIKSPDVLADILRKAKQEELRKFPLTQGLLYANETLVTVRGSTCNIL